jgi:hypothetical protein
MNRSIVVAPPGGGGCGYNPAMSTGLPSRRGFGTQPVARGSRSPPADRHLKPSPTCGGLMTSNVSSLLASCRSCPKRQRTVPHLRRYGGIASATGGSAMNMNKPRMDMVRRDGAMPALVVKVQRRARPPTPWTWAIHEDGQSEPVRCSTRLYRSAEDAWTVGRAMLGRLPRPVDQAVSPVDQNGSLNHEAALTAAGPPRQHDGQ